MPLELTAAELRRSVDPAGLPADSTQEIVPVSGIVGQPRAVAAIELGLNIRQPGFNVYVSGPPGIGKMTAVRAFIEKIAGAKDTPGDWCYVNNFEDSYTPTALRLPPGNGPAFAQDVRALLETIRRGIPRIFEGESYTAQRDEVGKALDADRSAVFEELNRKAAEAGHTLQPTPIGLMIVPMRGKRPLREHEMGAMPAAERASLEKHREMLEAEAKAAMKRVRELERAAQQKIRDLDRQVAMHVMGGPIEDLAEKYRDVPNVETFLQALRDNIVENLDAFRVEPGENLPAQLKPLQAAIASSRERLARSYAVNVLVAHAPGTGAPVVVELNPTYPNLFGHVEKEAHLGALQTDFTMIKPGALHRANGGFLVLPIEDVLRNVLSWDALKRALRAGEVQIEEIGERLGIYGAAGLRPQAIPLDVKVVLLGRSLIFHLLAAYDPEFREQFKVKADFDTRFELTPESVKEWLGWLCTFCRKEKLRPLDRAAVARVLGHASRLAEDQEKLSLHFGAVADLVREADYWAGRAGAARVGEEHVRKALDEKVFRSDLLKSRIQELIARGTLLMDLDGEAVGQVNGLSVILMGDYEFGRPTRITARVGPGREGIVDIEREVELGGPIHSKGVMILGGFLTGRYAADRPLNLTARLVFEQSYEGVEGDSASSAELYAVLSALSGVPLRQGIAVTGSVNQNGDIQAIGGVNEKIEGFFEVCRQKGLTGKQGVVIPRANARHLVLRDEVVEAVKAGKFHVWAVATVDEGLRVLTGRDPGTRGRDGRFPADSINGLADARICHFAECAEAAEQRKLAARRGRKAEAAEESRRKGGGRRARRK